MARRSLCITDHLEASQRGQPGNVVFVGGAPALRAAALGYLRVEPLFVAEGFRALRVGFRRFGRPEEFQVFSNNLTHWLVGQTRVHGSDTRPFHPRIRGFGGAPGAGGEAFTHFVDLRAVLAPYKVPDFGIGRHHVGGIASVANDGMNPDVFGNMLPEVVGGNIREHHPVQGAAAPVSPRAVGSAAEELVND